MSAVQYPAHWGMSFTNTIHDKPEGPTDPKNNQLPDGFVVVVTGAGKGLGYNICLAYARAGAKGIVIASRTQADLDKLKAEIGTINPGIEVVAQTCDTMKEDDVERLAQVTKDKFGGRLDVVIANAGIISSYLTKADNKSYLPVGIVEDSSFERVIQTNLMGSYYTAKHFVPLSPQAFVNITSVSSHLTDSTITPLAYNLSKSFINRMVESIHNDHFEKDGVQAFAVHPGTVLTPQTERHHMTQMGEAWTGLLVDDPGLCGGFLTWLTKEKRDWLSGRYVSVNWDVEELEAKKDEIVAKDLLKFRMAV